MLPKKAKCTNATHPPYLILSKHLLRQVKMNNAWQVKMNKAELPSRGEWSEEGCSLTNSPVGRYMIMLGGKWPAKSGRLSQKNYLEERFFYLHLEECIVLCQDNRKAGPSRQRG